MKKLKKPKLRSRKSLKPLEKSSHPQASELSPPESTTASTLPNGSAEFEKAIGESEAKLAGEMAPRRGRGRPRKNVSVPQEGNDVASASIGNDRLASVGMPTAGYPTGTTTALWKIGSKFAAARTSFDGWNCDAAECEALDSATLPVLNKYFPPELAEASPILTMAITLTAVFGMKTIAYYDWKREQFEKAQAAAAAKTEPQPIPTSGSLANL